jgi:hypothetical protein
MPKGCSNKKEATKAAKKKPKTACKKKEQTCPLLKKEVIEIKWLQEDIWCSEKAKISGKTKNYKNGETTQIKVTYKDDNSEVKQFDVTTSGDSFQHEWEVLDVLPKKKVDKYVEEMKVDGKAADKATSKSLNIHFIPNVTKKSYSKDRAHFDLSSSDYVNKIESNIKYVKGWGASVVKLGASAPSGTGGLLDSKFTWSGYRWMKKVGVTNKYWDGSAWKNLPSGFSLQDSNNFCVGFYKSGTKFTCQYGGNWPENFTDWDIDAETKQQKIKNWEKNIKDTWSGKFHIKRKKCKSTEQQCCRYKVQAEVKFVKQTSFSEGYLIIADGNIRSNDSLFFLGESRIAMAAHEFGHHIGNPDEYAGAKIDTSLNEDGAVNGIDNDSIMGQNLTKVKKRHFRTICKHFAKIVKDEHHKDYTYEATAVT